MALRMITDKVVGAAAKMYQRSLGSELKNLGKKQGEIGQDTFALVGSVLSAREPGLSRVIRTTVCPTIMNMRCRHRSGSR